MSDRTLVRRVLTIAAAVLCFILASDPTLSSAERSIQWQRMDQLCGSVESVIPVKKVIRRPNGKTETLLYSNPIKSVRVAVYRAADQDKECCDAAAKLGEKLTDQNGAFRSAGYVGGYYWLVIGLKEGEVRVPVKVDNYNKTYCEAPSTERIILADELPKARVETRII